MIRFRFCRLFLAIASCAFAGCTLITAGATEDVVHCAGRDDGSVCGNEIDDDIDRICVAGSCVVKECGDGFADGENAEECDDGNEVAGDGCDPTTCYFECEADTDCDDARPCTGTETCNLETHACVAGTPVVCTPSDPCHVSVCEETGATCVVSLVADVDGDGHVSSANYPSCGDDCDDADPTSYPGHAEVCGDGKDNNCTAGTTDEATLNWYADCDKDDYALAGALMKYQCTIPATDAGSTGCGHAFGGWTNRVPNAQNTRDCSDSSAAAHPDDPSVSFDDVTFHEGTVPVAGGYDWDCDTLWEKGLTTYSVDNTCHTPCSGFCLAWCSDGWSAASAPACGATAQPFYDGACSGWFCDTCSSCSLTYRNQTCK